MTSGEVVGFVFLGFLFVEALLLSLWIPAYYRHGIQVSRTVVGVRIQPSELTSALEERFHSAEALSRLVLPRLAFRRLSRHEVGFQEVAGVFPLWSYVPVMRGLIRSGQDGRTVVIGILQWYPFAAAGAVVVGLWPSGPAAIALALVGILSVGLIFWAVQRTRFRAVAARLDRR